MHHLSSLLAQAPNRTAPAIFLSAVVALSIGAGSFAHAQPITPPSQPAAPASQPQQPAKILILSDRTTKPSEGSTARPTQQQSSPSQLDRSQPPTRRPPSSGISTQAMVYQQRAARAAGAYGIPGANGPTPTLQDSQRESVDRSLSRAPIVVGPHRPSASAQPPQSSASSPRSASLAQQSPADRNRRLEERYLSMRRAEAPTKAGVPRREGVGKPNPAQLAQSTPVAQDASAASTLVQPADQPPPTGLVLLRSPNPPQPSNPAANELRRSGDSYIFEGKLNGRPVQFRLSDSAVGLTVPTSIALSHGVLRPDSPAASGRGEVYTPVQSMSVGDHPVTAVMARVVPSSSLYVDVGVDALGAFKVVMQNGRRLIQPQAN